MAGLLASGWRASHCSLYGPVLLALVAVSFAWDSVWVPLFSGVVASYFLVWSLRTLPVT